VLRSVDGLPANPYIVAMTATGRAYVSSPHGSKVTEIDVAGGRALRTIEIPDDPAGIAVSSDGAELYAAVWRENTGGGIVVYDLATSAIVAKLPATQPRRMTVTADARHVVVSDHDHLRIVDRNGRQVRSVLLAQDAGASGVTCSPDSTRCYVALSQAGEVVEVAVSEAKVLRRFATQRGVDGIGFVSR
jgi:DNA-binding beta-propeller fold protein YncE